MGTERNPKDDAAEGSDEVADAKLKRQGAEKPKGNKRDAERPAHPTEEELGPKGVP